MTHFVRAVEGRWDRRRINVPFGFTGRFERKEYPAPSYWVRNERQDATGTGRDGPRIRKQFQKRRKHLAARRWWLYVQNRSRLTLFSKKRHTIYIFLGDLSLYDLLLIEGTSRFFLEEKKESSKSSGIFVGIFFFFFVTKKFTFEEIIPFRDVTITVWWM